MLTPVTPALCSLCTGTIEVDAHNVVLTICEFSYVAVPFGIATAATIRVGNMLGANNPESARRSGAPPCHYLMVGRSCPLSQSGKCLLCVASCNERCPCLSFLAGAVIVLQHVTTVLA